MRIGIVGSGLQAKRRALALKKVRDAEIKIISGAHLEGAKALAAQIGCEAAIGWDWVLQRKDIDIVFVCTPPDSHHAISLAALRSGKHVLCEKPLARTLSEAQEMVFEAEKAGLMLKCGFNHRHHPAIEQARQWIDEGKIGKLLFIRTRYGICGRPDYSQEWRANPERVGGGQLMEQGIHVIDLCRWILGDLAEVSCFLGPQYWPMAPLEDNAFVMLRTEGGQTASIHSSLTQWKNIFSFEIYGDEGYLNIEGLGGGYGTEKISFGRKNFNAPFSDETIEYRGEDASWLKEWREFTKAIQEKREPLGSANDGLEAMRAVLAAYESARSGKNIKIENYLVEAGKR